MVTDKFTDANNLVEQEVTIYTESSTTKFLRNACRWEMQDEAANRQLNHRDFLLVGIYI